jgi:ATP-dependent helicase/nuclease subunit B
MDIAKNKILFDSSNDSSHHNRILHKISPDKYFIESLGRIIIDNYFDSLDRLRIILPTGFLCNELKSFLAKSLKSTSLLPFICNIEDFCDRSKFVFTYKLRADKLEETLILTNIILEENTLVQNFSSAYNLSKNLLEIFSQIHLNELSILDLKNYYFGEYSEYLLKIFDSIERIFVQLEEKLLSKNKIATFAYKQKFFELFRQKEDEHFIIAGILNFEKSFLNFINNLSACEFVYVFSENFTENQLMDNYLQNFKIDKISEIFYEEDITSSVQYLEFENEYLEAKSIANIINELFTKDKNAKIAIINKDPKIDKILEANLSYFGVEIFSNNKLKVSESCVFNLFIYLATFITEYGCEDEISGSDIVKFLNILNNPYIKEDDAKYFEFEIRKSLEKKDVELNFREILSKNEKLNSIYQILASSRKEIRDLEDLSFKKILAINLECMEKISAIYPWQFEIGRFLSKFFNKILKHSEYINLNSKEEYIYIIKSLFRNSSHRSHNEVDDHDLITKECVFNLSLEDVFLRDFDYIFITDFNECSWDKNFNETILPKKIVDELEIPAKYKKEKTQLLIEFCLSKKNVYLSRSLFKASKSTTKSSYLLKILNSSRKIGNFADNNLTNKKYIYKNHTRSNEIDIFGEKTIAFPQNISISSIGLLLNDPYSFYAEKILKLKKLERLEKDLTLADFGSIIHSIIDDYTKNYSIAKEIEGITKDKFEKLSAIYKVLWHKKAIKILNDFIIFDLGRRTPKKIIKSEINGNLIINTEFGDINIHGIADRIEVNSNSAVSIIDFKTGSIPTSSKVKQGKFPQLIIESLMLNKDGFGFGTQGYAKELIYVKLSHKEGNLSETNIEISEDEYEQHEIHLRKLLMHFLQIKCSSKYPKLKSEDSRFDNFVHLRRLI